MAKRQPRKQWPEAFRRQDLQVNRRFDSGINSHPSRRLPVSPGLPFKAAQSMAHLNCSDVTFECKREVEGRIGIFNVPSLKGILYD